jgi:hypothetical protein
MATKVPQSVIDYYKTLNVTPGNNEGAWYTDPEGYGWIGLSPQYTGGGDQGPQYAGEGVFMGGGTPTGYRRSANPGQKASTLGGSDLFYDASGNYTHTTQNDDMGVMDNPAAMAALIGGLAFGAPFLANAAGFGGAGAAAAGAAGGAGLGGGFGASLTGGIGTAVPAGAGFGTVGGSLGGTLAGTYGAGALGLDAAMAGLGTAGAAGAGAAMGAGSGALDLGGGLTMGADGAIAGGTGAFTPATAAEMAGMGVGSGGGLMSSIGAGVKSLTGGNGAGGFNWGSLIGPAVSAIGGVQGANAAKDAANAQLQAAREAQAKLEPWYQAGGNALNRLQELLGIGGNKGAADYGSAARDFGASDFQADPGYAFRKAEGEKALTRAASAGGGLGSGKYLKDAMAWNQGQASQEYDRSFNRFYTARQNKLSPFQSLAGQGQTTAQTMGDLSTQAGNAAAAGKVGSANAFTNALGQGYSMYQNSQQQDQNNSLMNLLLRRGSY